MRLAIPHATCPPARRSERLHPSRPPPTVQRARCAAGIVALQTYESPMIRAERLWLRRPETSPPWPGFQSRTRRALDQDAPEGRLQFPAWLPREVRSCALTRLQKPGALHPLAEQGQACSRRTPGSRRLPATEEAPPRAPAATQSPVPTSDCETTVDYSAAG